MARLEARVGPDGYDLIDDIGGLGDGWDDEDLDDDLLDEDFELDDASADEPAVLTVEGTEAPPDERR